MNIKNLFIPLLFFLNIINSFSVMQAQDRPLPPPSFEGGRPFNEVIAHRHSMRLFNPSQQIDDSTLAQILWLTLGINRPDARPEHTPTAANRCNPTAMNRQEIFAYVFGKDGVWKYIPESHSLKFVVQGDHRALIAGTKDFSQDFVMQAPYSVLFVADLSLLPEEERSKSMALIDGGIACENLNLACEAMGVATVPRVTMDAKAISQLLSLSEKQIPIINNPIGYLP